MFKLVGGTGKSVDDFHDEIRAALPDAPHSAEHRNRIGVALAGLVNKFGRTVANDAMDEFRLGRLGWSRF